MTAVFDGAPTWVLAARVELRRGAVLERQCAPGGSGIAEEDSVLFAAIEMLRSKDAPKRVFLLTEHHVHLYEIAADDPSLATVLVAPRAQNLGLLLSELGQVARGLVP
jgi:hypothetical protein